MGGSSPLAAQERTYQNDFTSSNLAITTKRDRRMSLDVRNSRRNPFSHGGALIGTRPSSGEDELEGHHQPTSAAKRKDRTLRYV
jgi:hypothetical protein